LDCQELVEQSLVVDSSPVVADFGTIALWNCLSEAQEVYRQIGVAVVERSGYVELLRLPQWGTEAESCYFALSTVVCRRCIYPD
jgi:hypothetical protein